MSRTMSMLIPAVAATAIGTTIAGLNSYMAAAGASGDTPAVWPNGVPIERATDGWTVVVAAHPRCPCTRATSTQLVDALSGTGADVVVLQRTGDGAADGGMPGPSVRGLSVLERVRFVADTDASIAGRFGALTSGHVVLFDESGRRRFSGGVTPARGMVGPATGLTAIRAILSGGEPPAHDAAVYGCPLDSGIDD